MWHLTVRKFDRKEICLSPVSKWVESPYKRLVRILVETIPIQEIID